MHIVPLLMSRRGCRARTDSSVPLSCIGRMRTSHSLELRSLGPAAHGLPETKLSSMEADHASKQDATLFGRASMREPSRNSARWVAAGFPHAHDDTRKVGPSHSGHPYCSYSDFWFRSVGESPLCHPPKRRTNGAVAEPKTTHLRHALQIFSSPHKHPKDQQQIMKRRHVHTHIHGGCFHRKKSSIAKNNKQNLPRFPLLSLCSSISKPISKALVLVWEKNRFGGCSSLTPQRNAPS